MSQYQQHSSNTKALTTIQSSETQRIKGVFNCADMPGETASLSDTTGCMFADLRKMFTVHQEEKRRAGQGEKPSSPYCDCTPALCQIFKAEKERREKAAQQEAERKDSPAARHVCKSG